MGYEISTEEALDILYGLAEHPGDVREDYTGRGMYGRTCVAIVSHNPNAVIEKAAQAGLTGASTDSMGMRTVVYWSHIPGVNE